MEFLERASANDFAALVAALPPLKTFTKPAARAIESGMRDLILEYAFAGEPTTRADLARRGYADSEIDLVFPRAASAARAELEAIGVRGIRRARIRAGGRQ